MKLFRLLIISVLLIMATPKKSDAQIDTVFWFAAPWTTPDHWWRDPIAFHFATFGNPTTIRLFQPAGTYDTTFTVAANSLFSKTVHHIINQLESKPANAVLTTGFKIEATFPITVVYDIITRSPNFFNPETFSLKGQNGMGTEFVVPFQTRWRTRIQGGDLNGDGMTTQPFQQFNVVATEDNTTIYITPKTNVVGHVAGVTYAVILPLKGNVYTCQNLVTNTNIPGNNLAGSIVVSNKPVSVTMSDDSVQPIGGCADVMGDQIVPTDVIGKQYIVNQGFLNAAEDESIFIVGTDNFTTVNVDNGITVTSVMINQGETYKYSITQPRTFVYADKNVYLLHMSGYGCELGAALLPPLNCAGSDQISFSRANGQNFRLNITCMAGTEGAFTLNGSTTLVPAGAFSPVPGTAGVWLSAQIAFNTTDVPVGSANIITNSMDLFSLGIINGGTTTGCLFHYVSSFIRKVFVNTANDTTLCNGEPSVALTGTITGGANEGIWTVINGTGTITNPDTLSTTYIPSSSDFAQGTVSFVLTSTGNCNPVSDTMKVDFIQSASVNAGMDQIYCKNNLDTIPLNGMLSFAAGASWSGGTGGAFDNPGSLNTYYTPSPSDLAANTIDLILTSAGSFFACPDDIDTVKIIFTQSPVVDAGPDITICSSTAMAPVSGTVTGPTTTGMWNTTGSGTFDPNASTAATSYQVSQADTSAGFVVLYLTSTNNGNCLAVTDSVNLNIIDKPTVQITSEDTICSNLNIFNLDGIVTTGFGITWIVNGTGSINDPNNINTFYNISSIDTTNAYLDVYLETDNSLCPTEIDSLRVYFVDPPKANAGIDQAFCTNEPIQLTGSVTGANNTGQWSSTGSGTFSPGVNFLSTTYFPSAADLASGNVSLILTATQSFGCTPDKDTLFVTFKPSPIANFSSTIACQGNNTVFTDLSTAPQGTINGWDWTFGDLTANSIAQNPNHTYPASGTFTATLIASSSNGCSDTISKQVTVNPLPIAQFSAGLKCEGNEVPFTDMSFISSGTITSWSWTFGDGQSSTLQNPGHIYVTSATYQVTLEVTSALGCTDTSVQNIFINPSPNADFSFNPNPAIVLENVQFTDLSTGNGVNDWLWFFGDGEGTNIQNPIHNYSLGGTFNVELLVTDQLGCKDSTSKLITVALLPVLPSGFSPNGDGENDLFYIRGGAFQSVNLKVYNHWGELVHEGFTQAEGWDGTFKGEDAPVGVYTWTFVVEIANGRIIKGSGDVTLIR